MELFQYDFMQRALAAGIITAILCPLIGMFIVIRRQSLLGDGLGHIAFAGVTGGYLAGIYPAIAAIGVTVLGAIGIEMIRRRHSHHADTTLAIFFYAGIAMAIIFSTMTRMPSAGLLSFLFGSIITVSAADVALIGILALVVIVTVTLLFQKLMLASFDEEIATVSGVDTGKVSIIFSVLTAIVVVVGMMIVGILLVSALMIVPVATAHLLGRGFKTTLTLALGFSICAVIVGLILSFHLDIAPGGTIVMTSIALYLFTMAYTYTQDYNRRYTMSSRYSHHRE